MRVLHTEFPIALMLRFSVIVITISSLPGIFLHTLPLILLQFQHGFIVVHVTTINTQSPICLRSGSPLSTALLKLRKEHILFTKELEIKHAKTWGKEKVRKARKETRIYFVRWCLPWYGHDRTPLIISIEGLSGKWNLWYGCCSWSIRQKSRELLE